MLEQPSPRDLEVIQNQLGRHCRGEVLIARRCPRGSPAVVFTVPFELKGHPVPPLLWLSCPHASAEVGGLESAGLARDLGWRIEADPAARKRLMKEEDEFALLRSGIYLEVRGKEFAGKFGDSGIAGGRRGAVKCLHAHLAYRLAGGSGIVGELCLAELNRKAGAWCEKMPKTCIS